MATRSLSPRVIRIGLTVALCGTLWGAGLLAQAHFPADALSVEGTWSFPLVRLCQLAIALIIGIATQGVGALLLRALKLDGFPGGLEWTLRAAFGILALSIWFQVPAAMGALRFSVIACTLCAALVPGTAIFLEDLRALGSWLRERRVWLALILIALLLIPLVVRAALAVFDGDELFNYLTQIRGFSRQGSFLPLADVPILNTFPSAGFSLFVAGYALGGEGVVAFLGLGVLLALLPALHGFTRRFAPADGAMLAPVLFLFLGQNPMAGSINHSSFLDTGLGLTKLHGLTALYLFAVVVILLRYLEERSRPVGLALALLLSFFAGIQILGVALLAACVGWLVVESAWKRRTEPLWVAAAAVGLSLPWYLMVWRQTGCPFPVAIAPFWATELCAASGRFVPAFYNPHYKYIFAAQNEALSGLRFPMTLLGELMKDFPFNLLLPLAPLLLLVRFPAMSSLQRRAYVAVLALVVGLIVINIPNSRYFVYVLPFLAIAMARGAHGISERFVRSAWRPWAVALGLGSLLLLFRALGRSESRPMFGDIHPGVARHIAATFRGNGEGYREMVRAWQAPRVGTTPFWVRDHLGPEARILHSGLPRWYYADRPTFQMSVTLGAPVFQRSLPAVLEELNRARITHLFFSVLPPYYHPDQFRFYSPLFEKSAFARYFLPVHQGEDGILYRYVAAGLPPAEKGALSPFIDLSVRVWRQ